MMFFVLRRCVTLINIFDEVIKLHFRRSVIRRSDPPLVYVVLIFIINLFLLSSDDIFRVHVVVDVETSQDEIVANVGLVFRVKMLFFFLRKFLHKYFDIWYFALYL
jgi:hypothetical protein